MTKSDVAAILIVIAVLFAFPGAAASQTATGATGITASGWHTCALTTGGGVLCWGYNGYGELGDGTTTDQWTPTAVSGLSSGVTAVAAGGDHTCALTAGGGVLCWGRNQNGELGDGTTTSRNAPTPVVGLGSGVVAIAAGMSGTCAMLAGGGLACWGSNTSGQVGDGTTTSRLTPTLVSAQGGWVVPPSVLQAVPAVGPATGGTTVTLAGTGFVAGATVTFDGLAATSVTVVSDTQIVAVAPAHAPGTVAIAVANADGGAATLAGGYEYLAVVPVDLAGTGTSSIAVFRPSSGQWWIDGQSQPVTFGQAGDIPVVADYNGDGKAELAVYRPST